MRYLAFNLAAQPPGTSTWSPGAGGDPFLASIAAQGQFQEAALGFFVDDCGDHYVALQNPNHTHGNFPTVLDTPATFDLELDFSTADPSVDTTQIEYLDELVGQVQTLPLTPAGGHMALSVTLPPGGLLLFKYKTDHPFALQ